MASTELTRSISSTTNRKTGTLSAWVKLYDTTGTAQAIFSNLIDGNNRFLVSFESGSILKIGNRSSGIYDLDYQTNRVFRDSSAWYHIVVAVDTTQATSSDRVKLWVNGVQETSFSTSTAPSQNSDTQFNLSGHDSKVGGANKLDGLLAHVHWIDGTAYDASTFGEFDSNGVWKPKTSPSVTYGTNGFFLKFENSGSMGTDSSGNGNNFTVNGTLTQTLDTPSNVYPVINPLYYTASLALTNGNLTVTNNSAGNRFYQSNIGVSAGKWYAEVKIGNESSAYPQIGIFDADAFYDNATYVGSTINGFGYASNGEYWNNNSGSGSYGTWTTNDIIGVAIDCDNDKVYWSKNGTWINSADPSAGTGGFSITADKTWFFAGSSLNGGVQHFNFGNGYFGTTAVSSAGSNGNGSIFEYDVPTGYYALNTKNLATYG